MADIEIDKKDLKRAARKAKFRRRFLSSKGRCAMERIGSWIIRRKLSQSLR